MDNKNIIITLTSVLFLVLLVSVVSPAWFDNDFEYKRTISDLDGNISGLYTIDKDNDMNWDFSDVRFINTAGDTELNYSIADLFGGVGYGYDSFDAGLLTSLISYYKLDEASGTIADAYGSNDGTYNGALYSQSGVINTAIGFDGSNDGIDLGDIDGTSAMSISGWFKTTEINGVIVSKDCGTAISCAEYRIYVNSDGLLDSGRNNGSEIVARSGITVNDGEWHYAVSVMDTDRTYLYLDGTLQSSVAYSGTQSTTTDNTYIGRRGNGLYFNGDIDEVGIWSRALTASEVAELYNATEASFRVNNLGENEIDMYYGNPDAETTANMSDVYFNPISAYFLDSSARDYVGSNHGTVTGATLSSGYVNGSYTFTDDTISATSGIQGDTTTSITAWFKTGSVAGTIGRIACMNAGDAASKGVCISFEDSQTGKMAILAEGIAWGTRSSASYNDDNWHFAVATQSGTTLNLYVDNSLVSTLTSTPNLATKTEIGQNNGAYGFVDGEIDEVYVYDKTLTQDEIYQLYTQTAPSFTLGAEETNSGLEINLLSPENNYNASLADINLTCEATSSTGFNLSNVSIYTDNSGSWEIYSTENILTYDYYNYTNEITLLKDIDWNCEACDINGTCEFDSSNYSINLGTLQVEVEYPENLTTIYNNLFEINGTVEAGLLQNLTNVSLYGNFNGTFGLYNFTNTSESTGGDSYQLSGVSGTWANVRSNCQAIGTGWDLVKIDDATENAYLQTTYVTSTQRWIGATDSASEGTWKWIRDDTTFWIGASGGSCQPGMYCNWYSGEPNDAGSNEDGGMIYYSPIAGQWNDGNVAGPLYGICEYTGSVSLEEYNFSYTNILLQDAEFYIEVCDTTTCITSDNYTIYLDSIAPNVTIDNPVEGEIYSITGYIDYNYPEDVELNWTIEDEYNLEACWYEYNDTNTSITCDDNTTTFNMMSQTYITLYANDTLGNINSDTISWIYNAITENTTTLNETTNCDDNTINFTSLPDGTYYINATTCDIYDKCSSTETRTIYLDTTFPLIEYAPNSDEDNKTGNFTDKDWIFANVTYTEINEKNVTFLLWNTSGIQDSVTRTFNIARDNLVSNWKFNDDLLDYQSINNGTIKNVAKAYYPFNGNAVDESDTAYDGTVSGPTLTTDRFDVADKAYEFDADGERITVNIGNISGQFTFSTWINVYDYQAYSAINGNTGLIGGSNLLGGRISFFQDKDNIMAVRTNTSTDYQVPLSQSMPENEWYMLTVTRDSSNVIDVYKNGVEVSSSSVTAAGNISFTRLFDNPDDSSWKSLYGKADEVIILQKRLNSNEVKSLYEMTNRHDMNDIYVDGRIGKAVDLYNEIVYIDGSGGDIDMNSSSSSISFWVYVTDEVKENGAGIMSSGTTGSGTEHIFVFSDSGGSDNLFFMEPTTNSVDVSWDGKSTVSNGWHHYVFTAGDGKEPKLYFDGVDQGAPDRTAQIVTDDYDLRYIGGSTGYDSNYGDHVSTIIDDLRIYNITLTEIEAIEIYSDGYGSEEQTIGTQDADNYWVNWTDLEDSMYFWNVTICDLAGNCNTTDTYNFGVEFTELIINLEAESVFAELRSNMSINATNNLDIVCIDIDHYKYGVNYTCGYWETGLDFYVDNFRKKTLSNGENLILLDLEETNLTTFNISMHKYDEVDNVSFNITGYEDNNGLYPQNVFIYKLNETGESSLDRWFGGYLIGNRIYDNTNYQENSNVAFTFSNLGDKSTFFTMDDNAKEVLFKFNVTGTEYGFEYENYLNNNSIEDTLISNAHIGGGYILPGGNNPMSFIVGNYSNTSYWTPTYSYSDDGDGGFHNTNSNVANETYLKLDVTGFTEDADSDNTTQATITNNYIANWEEINHWTPEQIQFEVEFSYRGDTGDSPGYRCNSVNTITYGGATVFSNVEDGCNRDSNDGSQDCYYLYYTEPNEPLVFTITKTNTSNYLVTINGTYHNFGNEETEYNDCGYYNKVYNYTNGTMRYYYTSPDTSGDDACNDPYKDTYTPLTNEFNISGLSVYSDQVKFNQYLYGWYRNDEEYYGCESISPATFEVNYFNQTLLNRTNSSFASNTLFLSGGDIVSITENIAGSSLDGQIIYLFVSADGGDNWQNVEVGEEEQLTNIGTDIRVNFTFTNPGGYLKSIPFVDYFNLSTPKSYPNDLTFDFGNDGIIDANISGELNSTNSPYEITIENPNLTGVFNGTADYGEHTFLVPLTIESDSLGIVSIDNFNLTYNPNPIYLTTSYIQTYLDNYVGEFFDISFTIGRYLESVGGRIYMDFIGYDYAGGNNTIEINAHNVDYSVNDTLNITQYYSRWDYEFVPTDVDFIQFTPSSPTAKNVTPYGQTALIPLLNITNYGYGGKGADLSIYVNDSLDCVNLTVSLTENKSDGIVVNESWINLDLDQPYMTTRNVWMWADFSCDYSTWRYFDPYIYFRQCAEGTICSEELI